MNQQRCFKAVVIGASAGGLKALRKVLGALPEEFPLPILIVQHLHPDSGSYLVKILNDHCALHVKQAEEKEKVQPGIVYVAPPNYHLLLEEDFSLSLTVDARVNFSRPSVDVLFETAVYAYRDCLIGIILTGANSDGSKGALRIKQHGGYLIVQDPASAEAPSMPETTIELTQVDKILPLEQIGPYLLQLVNRALRDHFA